MKRRLLLRIVGATFFATALVFLLLDASRRYPVRLLPDGSELAVLKVAFTNGYSYRHYRGTRFQRILNDVVPAPWKQRLGLKNSGGGGFRFGDTNLTSLFLVTSQKGGSASSPINLERIHLVDRDGSSFEATWDAITLNEPKEIVQGWRFKAFPRRGKTVRCRFIYKDASDNYTNAAEIEVPNPAPGLHPTWTPEVMPLKRNDGDLSVTLLDFVAGLHRDQDVLPQNKWYWIGRTTTRAEFEVEEAGKKNPPWRIQSLLVSDATGNRWKPGLEEPLGAPVGDRLELEFIGALWPSEPAWKLRVEFSRTNDFAPDELWTLPGIPVPATNQVSALGSSYEVKGGQLQIVALGGVGAELQEPFRPLADGKSVNLALTFIGHDLRLTLAKVVDNEGRSIPFREPYPWFESERSFALELAGGAKSISATFAVHRSRFVEFIVKPRQVGKNLLNSQ